MIKSILARFGYVKRPVSFVPVTLEVIQISMRLEEGYHTIRGWFPGNKEVISLHESAKTLTEFLRSGK